MQYKKYFIIFVLISFSYLYSQQLTWEQVLSEAKEKNISLKQSYQNLEQARIQYYRTRTNFYPQATASAGSSISDSPNIEPKHQYSYNISASISLYSGLSDLNRLKIRTLELKIAEQRYKRTLADMVYNLKKSFLDLLYAQELVSLSEKILQRRIQNFELVKFKYESGREDLGSLLRVEADKLQAEYDLSRAKRNLKIVSMQLAKEIGKENFDIIKVTGSFVSDLNIDKDLDYTKFQIENIPEILIAKLNLQKSILEIEVTKGNYRPEVTLSGNAGFTDNKIIPENDKWSTGLNLRLTYPLYTAKRNVYDLKIANSNKEIAELDFENTKLQIITKLQSAINNYIDSVENIKVRERYLQASEEQATIISVKYMNGLTSYNEWYSVEENYINSQKLLLNAKRDAGIAEIYLKNVLGEE